MAQKHPVLTLTTGCFFNGEKPHTHRYARLPLLSEFLERQDCSVNATAFAFSNLVSLKLCLEFLIGCT